MRRILSITSVVVLVALALAGCRKDPIEFDQIGTLNLQLVKGFSYKTHNKGLWETFNATVTVIYESGEDVVYNCVFSDPTGSGVYSCDNSGDRIYIIRNMKFRINIDAEVDGDAVNGTIPESETEWLVFSDDVEELSVPNVMLYAGKARLGITLREVGGDCVHVFASLTEYEQDSTAQNSYMEGGFYYIEKKFADLSVSQEEWTFFPVERYAEQADGGEALTGDLEGFISELDTATEYSIKAFVATENLELYSRTVNFKTTSSVDSIMTMVTTEVNAGVDNVSITGRVYMKNDHDISKISYIGAYIYPTATPESVFSYGGTLDGDVLSINIESGLSENTEYTYYLYAMYDDDYNRECKSVESTFATEGSREFTVSTGRCTVTGVSDVQATMYGDIISGNLEYSSELGFYYGTTADNLSSFVAGQIMQGQNTFTATLDGSNYGVGTTVYYCAVVKSVDSYGDTLEFKGSNMNFTLQDSPEVTCAEPYQASTYSFDIACTINSNGRTCSEYGLLYQLTGTNDSVPTLEYGADGVLTKTFASSASGSLNITLDGLQVGSMYAYCLYAKYGDEIVVSQTYVYETYSIGGSGRYDGGTVFYAGTDFTLEMIYLGEMPDQTESSTLAWGAEGELVITTDVPSTSGTVTSGLSNTEAIVAQYGLVNTYAAPACRLINEDAYLPSTSEMEALCESINNAEGQSEVYIESGTYWTSDEVDADNARALVIESDGVSATYTVSTSPKSTLNSYICVFRY